MARFNPVIKPKHRWLFPFHGGGAVAAASQVATAGTVLLALFEVPVTVTVDQIVWLNGTTAAGNVRVGIYGPLVTEETCAGSPIVYDSGDIAQIGTSTSQAHTLSTVKTLLPGRYYLALEFSDATATYLRHTSQTQVVGWGQLYARGGGYGAFTTPCPAVSTNGNVPGIRVRCVV
jgi:hypothetical protein